VQNSTSESACIPCLSSSGCQLCFLPYATPFHNCSCIADALLIGMRWVCDLLLALSQHEDAKALQGAAKAKTPATKTPCALRGAGQMINLQQPPPRSPRHHLPIVRRGHVLGSWLWQARKLVARSSYLQPAHDHAQISASSCQGLRVVRSAIVQLHMCATHCVHCTMHCGLWLDLAGVRDCGVLCVGCAPNMHAGARLCLHICAYV
jgi:hypothetical protein